MGNLVRALADQGGSADRGHRRVDVEPLGLDLRVAECQEPSWLGHDVGGEDHDPPSRVGRRGGVGQRGRRGPAGEAGASVGILHDHAREPRSGAGEDDPAQQREPRDHRVRRHAGAHAGLGWDDEEQAFHRPPGDGDRSRQVRTPETATSRPPCRLDSRAPCSSATQSVASARFAPRGPAPVASARNWRATASNQSG